MRAFKQKNANWVQQLAQMPEADGEPDEKMKVEDLQLKE